MSYLIQNLIMDVLPRVGKIDSKNGITVYSAANSILSLVFKRLLDRRSDLLVNTEDMYLQIPANGYYADLPTDFLSLAEKPKSSEMALITWLNNSGLQVLWMNNLSQIVDWQWGTGYIQDILEPSYLDDDTEHNDYSWWTWYGNYGESYDYPSIRPKYFTVIGRKIYVRPRVTVANVVTGKYFSKPDNFSSTTDVIPWNGFFDEIFREGVVRIIQKGISIPEIDPDFVIFLSREIDTVLNSRISLIPDVGRTHRSNFM